MSDNRVRRVLIVGGGTAGWMTAAALSNAFATSGLDIELVESEAIGTVGVGEATLPHIRYFNAGLGIDEAEFIRETQATYKLAIEFRNWRQVGDSYLHPFGDFGQPGSAIDFHHIWAAFAEDRSAGALDAYSLAVQMCRKNRFAQPGSDPSSLLSTYSYAYQFDAGRYARFLRAYAEARGVRRTEGRITSVETAGETGHVESVTLEDGTELQADFFVDCSGFRGLLIEQTCQAGFEDWSQWLPCDRAIALPSAITKAWPPYTRATALEAGWAWRIPLQHRCGNGHVYASAFLDDDRAEAQLRDQLEGAALAEPNRLRFRAGKRRSQWVGNCVAIGLSSGFLEPLESTSIHLIQVGLGYLLDLFPTGDWRAADTQAFNRIMALEYERVRDFLILHYKATERDDSPFWDYCRTMPVPDSLVEKIELFRERGLVAIYEKGVFLAPSWVAVFMGQGIHPHRWDARCQAYSADQARAGMSALKQNIDRLTDRLPQHRDTIMKMIACEPAGGGA